MTGLLKRIFLIAAVVGATLGIYSVPADAAPVTMYAAKSYGSGADAGDIVILNPADTSQSTTVGNPGLSGAGITGIDFDIDGNLWGSTLGDLGSASTLIQIDPESGALVNEVGPIHTDAFDAAGSAISIGDLAYNPLTNT
ncbi:MAG: hypothetical protein WD470_13040, partial [Rhodospirillaceae bacterium]